MYICFMLPTKQDICVNKMFYNKCFNSSQHLIVCQFETFEAILIIVNGYRLSKQFSENQYTYVVSFKYIMSPLDKTLIVRKCTVLRIIKLNIFSVSVRFGSGSGKLNCYFIMFYDI